MSYFKVPLNLFQSEAWLKPRVWSKAELIIWLHGHQSFKDGEVTLQGKKFPVKVGETIVSIKLVEKLTGWSKARVLRFFSETTHETTCETRYDTTGELKVTCVFVNSSRYLQDNSDGCETTHVTKVSSRRTKNKTHNSNTELQKDQKVHNIITAREGKPTFNPDPVPELNDCWFKSEADWLDLCEEIGEDPAYYLLRIVTNWVRGTDHLGGRWWQMDASKQIKNFYEKEVAKGKKYSKHPINGEGFYFESQVRKSA